MNRLSFCRSEPVQYRSDLRKHATVDKSSTCILVQTRMIGTPAVLTRSTFSDTPSSRRRTKHAAVLIQQPTSNRFFPSLAPTTRRQVPSSVRKHRPRMGIKRDVEPHGARGTGYRGRRIPRKPSDITHGNARTSRDRHLQVGIQNQICAHDDTYATRPRRR